VPNHPTEQTDTISIDIYFVALVLALEIQCLDNECVSNGNDRLSQILHDNRSMLMEFFNQNEEKMEAYESPNASVTHMSVIQKALKC
jgi:hypothetical protein